MPRRLVEGSFVRTETAKERRRREAREERIRISSTRKRMMFAGALAAERLGPHPGRVAMRMELRMYDPVRQRWTMVPGWRIQIGAESIEAVDGMRTAAEAGIDAWLRGGWDAGRERLCCPRCGEVL
jgi:hypothetical protein